MTKTMDSALVPALVVTTLAIAACASGTGGGAGGVGDGKPTIQTADLRLADGSADGPIEIDDRYHDTVVVYRGDWVEWRCANCPEGTEFTVEKLHFVANLEHRRSLANLPDDRPPGPCDELGEGAPGEQAVDHPLFRDGWKPPGREPTWYAHDQAIVSKPVAVQGVKHGLWKFTWKVRRVGDPESTVCWDPHIFGHTGWSDK